MLYLHIMCAGDLNPPPPMVNVFQDGYRISGDYNISYQSNHNIDSGGKGVDDM